MKVTEHNITDWELSVDELFSLIRLIKQEIRNHPGDKATQTYYSVILGKLLILKYGKDSSETGTEETTITDL